MKNIISANLLLATGLSAQVSVEQYRDGGDQKCIRTVVIITNTGQPIPAEDLSFNDYIYEQNFQCSDFQYKKWYSSIFDTQSTQIHCTDLISTDETGNRKSNIELKIQYTGSQSLGNNESQLFKFGVKTNNWHTVNEADDWSFINSSNPLPSTHISVFIKGSQVTGITPITNSNLRHNFIAKQWMAQLSTADLANYTFEEGDFYTNTDDENTYQYTGGAWQLFFKTPGSSSSTLVESRDDQSYKTTTIGSQKWMAENLNYNANNSACYNYNLQYCDHYGRLYSSESFLDGASSSNSIPSGVQGVCPDGWHLPSNGEWQILIDYINANSSTPANNKNDLTSQYDWPVGSMGSDRYGFNALPAGYMDVNVSHSEYNEAYWLSTSNSAFGSTIAGFTGLDTEM